MKSFLKERAQHVGNLLFCGAFRHHGVDGEFGSLVLTEPIGRDDEPLIDTKRQCDQLLQPCAVIIIVLAGNTDHAEAAHLACPVGDEGGVVDLVGHADAGGGPDGGDFEAGSGRRVLRERGCGQANGSE